MGQTKSLADILDEETTKQFAEEGQGVVIWDDSDDEDKKRDARRRNRRQLKQAVSRQESKERVKKEQQEYDSSITGRVEIFLKNLYNILRRTHQLRKFDPDQIFWFLCMRDLETNGTFTEDPMKYRAIIIKNLNGHKELQKQWHDTDFQNEFHKLYSKWYEETDFLQEDDRTKLETYWNWRKSKIRTVCNYLTCGMYGKGKTRKKRKKRRKKTRKKTRRKKKRKK